jgi:hypothetical protein
VRRLLAISATVLVAGCGGGDDGSGSGGGGGGGHKPRGDEPPIPASANLCPDLKYGGKFVAFRVVAQNVSCDDAAPVVVGAVKGTPPKGWPCKYVRTLVTCRNGQAVIEFNSARARAAIRDQLHLDRGAEQVPDQP